MYRRLLWPVLAPSVLFGVAAGATVPVSVLAAMDLGASAALAALIVAIVGAFSLATTVPAGMLIDRVGDRRAMLLATGAAAVVTAVTVGSLVWAGPGALALFMASTFLRAPAVNVWSLARQAYVAERVPTREVGRAMTALGGTMRIGALAGPLMGGLLLLVLPLWSVYVLSVGCSLLALAILYAPRLGGRHEEGFDASGRRNAVPDRADGARADSGPSAAADRSEGGRTRVRLDVRWDAVVLAGVAISTLAMARVAQAVLIQLWGTHVGLTAAQISLAIATGAAVEILLMFPAGYLKDRLGRSPVLVACLLVYGCGFLVLPLADTWWGVVGAVGVMSVGNGLGAGINMTIGADLSPPVGRGRFLGIWALFSNVGVLGGPGLVSLLLVVASTQAAVLAVGGLALSGAAWMAAWSRRIGLPRGL
ncbi:MFS transporter [Ornithinimicrobium pratense]|uniref:MFS transporter n=1 Tax=Ornithinimicrobium pratense TaxID=2593973 RepID=A0A5J6V3P8_9MICO|nr:MFS transporter [Ornithinimicrobium pratense]QFG68318.1 MFS transporter [Ornithinimicrobium pratense]